MQEVDTEKTIEETEDEAFDRTIRELRKLQSWIDDTAITASREISKIRSLYNYKFSEARIFLADYGYRHLKPNKRTGELGRSYRSIGALGGLYFRSSRDNVSIPDSDLQTAYNYLSKHGLEDGLIQEEIKYTTKDPKRLVEVMRKIDPTFGPDIKIELGDPFAEIKIGSTKPWSTSESRKLLQRALEGTLEPEQETDQEDVE